ncbi:MAG: phenylalanine--tRNA ligase subunit beta [Bacilli bacterium]|nr:phenylalanine--tRNA ligase subunit beta [Bacilli bacterium]
MAISMNWVKDYVDLKDVDLKDLAQKITNAGVNVEHVISNEINNLVIGEVLECEDIPDTHLHKCLVDVGLDKRQIVCGANNVRSGIKVIVSLPGAILPGGFEIKTSTIRGYESNGMICALSELGLEEDTIENHAKGIFEMPNEAKVGEDPLKYMGLDDTIYELDLNPNRNIDCTNHIGFAYEVASVLGKKVTLPSIATKPVKESVKDNFSLEVNTPNCMLYYAKMVKDVVIKESPDFIKNRLINAGMRPINNVVDISNYVMLEFGQPLHFFDKKKLGDKILVRMAGDNESIVTLDKKERMLSQDDIVITDGNRPVCIAGVMGGENTEVDNDTCDILIESAIFNAYNVRYTSLRLDLRSEASLRYERGLNYEYTKMAIERACHLLEKYASGKVLSDTVIYDNIDKTEKEAEVTLEDINKTLGITITDSDVKKSLDNLQFDYEYKKGVYHVIIPNRRLDVEPHKQDLIEEIGRLYGYDKIVSTLPIVSDKAGNYIGAVKYRKLISKRLRALGLNEARTYTLVSDEENDLFKYNRGEDIPLLRPMSSDKKIIRQTILPSLLKAYDYNKARGVKDIFFYEIANTYSDKDKEDTKVAILMKGNYMNNSWKLAGVKTDFYLLKGIAENLFDYLGLKNRYQFNESVIDSMHPGITAEITVDKEPVGFMGRVHPNVCKDDVYVMEFSMTKLVDKKLKPIKYKEISKYPNIVKDLAFVVNVDKTSKELVDTIKKSGGKLLTNIDVFDVYKGENVLENEKSIAYSLTFSDPTRTLSDEEVMQVFNKIILDVTNKHNAVLRDK